MTSPEPARLTPISLASVDPSAVPTYRRDITPSIVHLGVGGFARAHLGTYADELLAADYPAAIHGISLLSDRAESQLVPQGCLYTVNERELGASPAPRVVGSFTRVSTGTDAAVRAIARSETRLVTLTVTEKGYVADADHGESTPAMVIARALGSRDRTSPPPAIAPLDNVLSNGRVLRQRVIEAAASFDIELARWIEASVCFADSVVDRIVPATTPADLAEISDRLGLLDCAAVVCEHHRSWVIAGYEGELPLDEVGVGVVADSAPYERRKLWLLNGPHSALAYAGLLTGCDSIAEAVDRNDVRAFVERYIDDVLEVVDLPTALDPSPFAASVMRRFANPALGHRCLQVGTDGSTKLPQRIVPVAMARSAAGLPNRRLATIVAIWLAALCGLDVPGSAVPRPGDRIATELDGSDPRRRIYRALRALDLGDSSFASEILSALDELLEIGPVILQGGR